MEKAIASFRAQGDIPAAALAMGTLGLVLGRLGDPRQWTLPVEALGLLEPLGPSPELVGALIEVAAVDAIQGRSEEAIRTAERALTLASELGLDRPARALGFRGMARAALGDPRGLEDYREAIDLAIQAGQGREVALLHNNLGVDLWSFEGPSVSLEVLNEGIAYAEARGLTEMLDLLIQSTLDALVDTGEHDKALEIAAGMTSRLEAKGDVLTLIVLRAVQARINALRGRAADVDETIEWIESSARETEDPQVVVTGLSSVALVQAGLGHDEAAGALLSEVWTYPSVRDNMNYPMMLPAMVRTALGIGEPSLAERLVLDYEPPYPLAEHALVAANAALTEARGDLSISRRRLHRYGRSLGAARGRSRAGVRAPRPGTVPRRALPTGSRGRTRPAARPRDLRAAEGGPRARRDRRAPAAGDGAQLVVEATSQTITAPPRSLLPRARMTVSTALTFGCFASRGPSVRVRSSPPGSVTLTRGRGASDRVRLSARALRLLRR